MLYSATGAERMSRGIPEQIGQLAALAPAFASGRPDAAMAAMTAYGVGVSAPFDRHQESRGGLHRPALDGRGRLRSRASVSLRNG